MNHTLPRIVIAAALLIVLSGPAVHARLGETEAQIKARFGEPQPPANDSKDVPLPGRTVAWYRVFGDTYVDITFRDGKSVKETINYQNVSHSESIADALLQKYADGNKWLGWEEIRSFPIQREPGQPGTSFTFNKTNLRDDGVIARLEGYRYVRDDGTVTDTVHSISFEVPGFELWQRKLLRDTPEGQQPKLDELKRFDVF